MKHFKIHLVENWKDAKKWFSVHAMLWAGAIQGCWLMIPEDMKPAVNPKVVSALTIGLMFFGIIGRVVSQEKPNAKN